MPVDGVRPVVACLLAAVAVALLVPPTPGLEARLRRRRRRVGGSRRGIGRIRTTTGPVAGTDLDAVIAIVDRLAALVRAGLPPPAAWQQLAALPGPMRPVCTLVAEAVRAGGSTGEAVLEARTLVPAGQRWWASPGPRRRPAAEADTGLSAAALLGWLGVTVAVSEQTGAPLATCLDRLATAVRAEVSAADERAGALAGPRATAQILGWLPVAGIGLGALVGANPVHALLATAPGRLCAAAGVALWFGGRAWANALVRAAERAGE